MDSNYKTIIQEIAEQEKTVSDITWRMKIYLNDEMRTHAQASKNETLEFQIFRVLGGYRQALARVAELEAEVEQLRSTRFVR